MAGSGTTSTIVLVRDDGADSDLVQTLIACDATVELATPADMWGRIDEVVPDTVVLELDGDHAAMLVDLASRLPSVIRLITVGNMRPTSPASGSSPLECVLFADPDEVTLRSVLAGPPPVSADILLDELLTLTVLGPDLADSLNELTARLARAFGADDCVLLLAQEETCYTARQISDDVIADLAPLAETVCQYGTTLVAPARPGRPYRTFLGVPLGQVNAPPLATLLLCRQAPIPFHRDARRHLRSLAGRLATDLSWRLVQERLLSDRDKLRGVSRVDPVLGVANRTALQEEMSQRVAASVSAGEPFTVAVIDVDGLRLVNERSGYPAGDAVLAHVAKVASDHTPVHGMVARYAGDSVAVVFPGVAADEASTMLTKILSKIDAEPVVHENKTINLTVSAGIAQVRFDDDADTGENALARAMAARQGARLHGEVIAVADEQTIVDAPMQPDFAIGTTLAGVYQIRHEISRGAFGVVYRAEDLALGRQVALKLLRPDLARDTAFVDRFRTEAATLARIRNVNLVQVYAFGIDGSNVFFAMELVEGQGLDERIESARKRRRHLPLPEVTGIINQVAHALEDVHRAGVLHRDVKPENVLIDRIYKRSVLVDVGIAVKRGSEKNPAGTPGFTAPEVFGDIGESPATDVYSLAALAYLLLTLQAPFGEASPLEMLHLQATQRPAAPSTIRKDLPVRVDGVLLEALDPDPRNRPQSAKLFAKTLSEALIPPAATESRDGTREGARAKPRMTLDPPEAMAAPKGAFRNASLRNAPAAVASTRGVMFRAAYEVLGARRGSAWMAEVTRKKPELERALGQHASPLDWHPTSLFSFVLHSLGTDVRDGPSLAFQLGKIAVATSFRQFYGADPQAVSPAHVLRAAEQYWRSYHNWGTAKVTARDNDADVMIVDGISNAILCSSTAGLLEGVIGHARGTKVDVEHRDCLATNGKPCWFHLSWR